MSDEKYKNKYRVPSARLAGYDYGANGCYYVTICTKNREHYFGKIVQDNVGIVVETDNYPSLHIAVKEDVIIMDHSTENRCVHS